MAIFDISQAKNRQPVCSVCAHSKSAHRRGVARLLDQRGVFGENAGLVILK